MASPRISFQLYSARNFPPIEKVLESLAAIGFDAVEPFGGNYMDDPAAFRSKADALGLAIPSAHVPLQLLNDDRAKAIDIAKTLGLEYVMVPYLMPEDRPADTAGWKALGARLGEHAAAIEAAGMKFGWHNHDFEYVTLPDGTRPIDHLLAPANVNYEMDVAWVARAGKNIANEIAREGSKIVAFHIKDTAPKGVTKDDGWTDVGGGVIDWRGLWPAIADRDVSLLVLENDNPSDWHAFASNSYKFLAGLMGRG